MVEQEVFHGGDIQAASRQFGWPLADWLDLSTGINPQAYPVPVVPEACYQQLPSRLEAELLEVARRYYGGQHLVAAAGSQRLIQLLPSLRPACRVAVPDVGYQEHLHHWRRQGHQLIFYSGFQPQQLAEKIAANEVDCAVVINPNNPTTVTVNVDVLLDWQQRLTAKGGLLVVDEAFADSDPVSSLAPYSDRAGLVVLRSLGKFFGLAGLRVGFALCEAALAKQLRAELGPWAVNGPAQFIAQRALADQPWQQATQHRLKQNSEWMASQWQQYVAEHMLEQRINPLFISGRFPKDCAECIFKFMAQRGILLRLWPLPDGQQVLLRSGLIDTSNQQAQQRFVQALMAVVQQLVY